MRWCLKSPDNGLSPNAVRLSMMNALMAESGLAASRPSLYVVFGFESLDFRHSMCQISFPVL
jgi:hypothetical protein